MLLAIVLSTAKTANTNNRNWQQVSDASDGKEYIMMELRTTGATGLQVTRLGLGLAALGRPGYITLGHAADLERTYDVSVMERRTHRVLDEAWQAGIRYFDAARSYGRAEQFLGSWLESRQVDPAEVTVGSKWGYTYTADWKVDADVHEVKEHSLEVLQRQWQETCQYLHRYIRLYQVHSATFKSGVLENQDVLMELARLKQDGLRIGLTVSGTRQAEVLQRALQITIEGQPLFDSIQATWNVLEPSAGEMLQAAHEAGLVVIVKEALANGRLTPRGTSHDGGHSHTILQSQSVRLNTTVDALAIAAVLAQPWVDVVLSGAARCSHLQSNIQAVHVAWDEEAAAALAELRESPDVYWQIRSSLAWN
jgi:aryl-alcohol dehydrogenase-like predicted oxidoreductase